MITFDRDGWRFTYRVAGVAIRDGRVLVQMEAKTGIWFLPGGRIEFGETAAESLKREMAEELGVDVGIGRLLWVIENLYGPPAALRHHEVGLYFMLNLSQRAPELRAERFFHEHDGVTLEFNWLPVESLDRMAFHPACLRAALRSLPARTEHIVQRDDS
jgi:8-oxo-dGTP pyrophosphatase MutT (NUDIX family)